MICRIVFILLLTVSSAFALWEPPILGISASALNKVTVFDRVNGINALPAWVVEDDYSTDTLANYTLVPAYTGTPGLRILNEKLTVNGTAASSTIYHHVTQVSATSTDMTVEAEIQNSGASLSAGLYARGQANGAGGGTILRVADTTKLQEAYLTGTTSIVNDDVISFTGGKTWPNGVTHLMRMTLVGGVLTVQIDWNDDGDYEDENEDDMGTYTARATSGGYYCGVLFKYNSTTDPTLDNFKCAVAK